MKKFIAIFVVLSFSLVSFAEDKKHAIGAMLGDPTGLSYRYQLEKKIFIDSGLDYRLGDRTHIYASYSKIAPESLVKLPNGFMALE